MSGYYLFLDDERKPQDVTWIILPENVHWEIVKNYEEFTRIIRAKGIPQFVTYDCDLCEEHYKAYFDLGHTYPLHYKSFKVKCGIDCAEYLLAVCEKLKVGHPKFLVHSKNNFGVAYIENLINRGLSNGASPIIIEDLQPRIPSYAIHSEEVVAGFFGEYRYLSNFWPCKIKFLGMEFPSVENAYQAAKAPTKNEAASFVSITPEEAKKLGRHLPLPTDWSNQNVCVMTDLINKKFTSNEELATRLLNTGTKHLEEANNWRDNRWGQHYEYVDGVWKPSGKGQNLLGVILMATRKGLNAKGS